MACFALLPRTHAYCSNCGEFVGTLRITSQICSRKLGGCVNLSFLLGTRTPRALPTAMLKPRLRGAARRAHGSSAEHAMRDLIASHAPLREGRHTARQNGPKHYPRGFKGIAIPLTRLSPLSFVVQRKMGPPEVAGLAARQVKTCSERWSRRRPSVAERGR